VRQFRYLYLTIVEISGPIKNNFTIKYYRTDKQKDNLYIESFYGKFRDESLSVNWFLDLDNAGQKIEA